MNYLKSRNRLLALGALLALSFAAAGRNSAQDEKTQRQEWPKEIQATGAKVTIYEPQVESLKGTRLSTRAAVSILPEGTTEPVFGAIWLESTLATDADGKTGRPENLRIAEFRFPTGDAHRLPGLRESVSAEIARWNLTYSMDALLADLRALEERKASASALKAEVPEINFRSHPAVLLTMDGDPEWRAVSGSSQKRLANSAFFVVEEANAGKCYLRISPFWWSAPSALGPWQAAEEVPEAIEELWKKEPRPQVLGDDDREEDPRRPEVIASTRPAELIWTDGLPQYAPIAGTDLLYVKNTTGDIFIEISTQNSYVLLSGRWFRTGSSKVSWEFVPSDKLPLDFGRIPLGSEKQHVLACVAGTAQARDAVKNAEIPQTEAVKPGPAPDMTATYDGEPQFSQIEDSPVRYAANSPSPIFSYDRRYYWCEDGIWYDADYAYGPWSVCSYVPTPIYYIPPSCPFYYVTFCRIFSVSPYSICFGYYPGYRGCYVWGPTIVYGTGWRYRWWVGGSCYIRPCTWGVGVRYNSWACNWTFSLGWGSSCAWNGVSTYRRAPMVAVGVGGGANFRGAGGTRNSVGVDAAVSVKQNRTDNLYVKHPEKLIRPVDVDLQRRLLKDPAPIQGRAARSPRTEDREGNDLFRRPNPSDADRAARTTHKEDRNGDDLLRRPNTSDSDSKEGRDRTPRNPRRDPEDVIPRNPPKPVEPQRPRDPDREPKNDNDDARRQPPRREDRETPKPPPPIERREVPRNPPPVERRDPPQREERREPPPPPPREERRAPPPPPVERREPPRQPPQQQDHRREPDRSSDRGSDRRK